MHAFGLSYWGKELLFSIKSLTLELIVFFENFVLSLKFSKVDFSTVYFL